MATTSRSCVGMAFAKCGSLVASGADTERDATRGPAGSLHRMPGPTPAVAHGSEPFRLPRTVEPETYRIEIEPIVASASFSGTVAIDVIILEAVEEIVLNAAELAVSDVEVRLADGSIVPCSVRFADELEQVVFRPSSSLPPAPPR